MAEASVPPEAVKRALPADRVPGEQLPQDPPVGHAADAVSLIGDLGDLEAAYPRALEAVAHVDLGPRRERGPRLRIRSLPPVGTHAPIVRGGRAGAPMTVCSPDLREERRLRSQGYESVAGLDEVGRGAWAGPLTVGVAVVPPRVQHRTMPVWLRDSKMLSEARREEIFDGGGVWGQ